MRFGTDGVRGPESELSDDLVEAMGLAAGRVLVAAGSDRSFLLARDTRASGPRIEAALARGLRRAGVSPESMGVAPTPAAAWASAVRMVPAAVISASHNPWTDNGIKFFGAGGRKLDDDTESELERAFDAARAELAAPGAAGVDRPVGSPLDNTGLSEPIPADGALGPWSAAVAGSLGDRRLDGLRVVIDCANGAGSDVAPSLLRALGAEVHVIHAQPDGRNINDRCGSTHPDDLRREVVAFGADVGLALDGDADRVIAVDERGELVDGDQLLALFAIDLHERRELAGDVVVVTVMSNLGFHHAMHDHGITVIETPVGDRHVLEALDRTRGTLGGEQSGHLVFSRYATTGDGLLSGVQLLDLVHRRERPLSELATEVMTRFPQVLLNVVVGRRRADVAELVEHEIGIERAALGDRGRVLVRPSGTEPVVRVMVEAEETALAEEVAARLAAVVERACSA